MPVKPKSQDTPNRSRIVAAALGMYDLKAASARRRLSRLPCAERSQPIKSEAPIAMTSRERASTAQSAAAGKTSAPEVASKSQEWKRARPGCA
ncbi:hypothetical protein D3C86_1694380 [compost metagenome]